MKNILEIEIKGSRCSGRSFILETIKKHLIALNFEIVEQRFPNENTEHSLFIINEFE